MSGVAIATVAVAGATMYSANQQKKATQRAADMQAKESERQRKEQEQQFNRQNQNQVDVGSILDGNVGGEMGSTLLTGAQGISRDQLSLGKGSNLLGG